MSEQEQQENPHGIASRPWATSPWGSLIAYLLIVAVAIGGFYSIYQQQKQNDRLQYCTQTYLSTMLDVVNARTEYSGEQAEANIELQRAQARFLNTYLRDTDPSDQTDPQRTEALRQYLTALTDFSTAADRLDHTREENPYPESDAYHRCLEESE